jgi:hypothetical protein
MNDLTVIYLTANEISERFAHRLRANFTLAVGDSECIFVSKKSMPYPNNLVFDTPRSHINIYREALAGVRLAETKYIAIAEDDVLYPLEHFKKRPTRPDVFAYNIACWSIYTWSKPPIFSYTGRRNHGMLICERDLYIEAFEERFAKFTDDSQIDNNIWAEPGKYERHLGVTQRDSEVFYTDPACIMFTHPEGLSFHTIGMRKRLAPIRAYEIPYWGRAEEVMKLYE